MSATGWVVLVIVVVAIIVIGGLVLSRRRTTVMRDRAESLRTDAEDRSSVVDQREAKAREIAAQADVAKAEAERKAAQADRLESVAGEHKARTEEAREEVEGQRAEADRIDPDVDDDSSLAGPTRGRAPGRSHLPAASTPSVAGLNAGRGLARCAPDHKRRGSPPTGRPAVRRTVRFGPERR